MTVPSSYVFYDRMNPDQIRQEGTHLIRVFITSDKITTYDKVIVKTAKSGVLFEKINSQRTYALNTNSDGAKYLKIFNKSAGGSITDASLETFMRDKLITQNYNVSNHQYHSLIEETIYNWFGFTYQYKITERLKDQLLFPVMHDKNFLSGVVNKKHLAELQATTGTVTKAMRENSDWFSFLQTVCGETILSEEDATFVSLRPNMMPVATLELGQTIREAYFDDSENLDALTTVFNGLDFNCIRFMLAHMPSAERPDAITMLLNMARLYQSIRQGDSSRLVKWNYSNPQVPFNRVPKALRPKLANEFLKSLKETETELQDGSYTGNTSDLDMHTWLKDIFRYWYAQIVMEPALKSKTTLMDVEKRFLELFNSPCERGNRGVKFHNSKSGEVFCSISPSYSGGPVEHQKDLFTSLDALAKSHPKSRGAETPTLNGYVNAEGKFISLIGDIHSLDDLMEIVESGVKELDKCLEKLGRAITPENRFSYLTFGHKERKFKNTWRYYDLGVKEPKKLIALKKCKITNKEDIQAYAELPDEMFYELIQMHSGVEINNDELDMALGR